MWSEGRQEVTAMRPYSMDLRERVAAAVKHHEGSIRQIARTFRVSTSFIVRLLQRRRRDARPQAPRWRPAPGPGARRPGAPRRPEPRATRRHVGATAAAGRLHLQLEDPVARLAPSTPDPQEEEPARPRAGPARGAEEAARVPARGPANRAETDTVARESGLLPPAARASWRVWVVSARPSP